MPELAWPKTPAYEILSIYTCVISVIQFNLIPSKGERWQVIIIPGSIFMLAVKGDVTLKAILFGVICSR
jgi:hypothetical protein